jgi:hypothetical protein
MWAKRIRSAPSIEFHFFSHTHPPAPGGRGSRSHSFWLTITTLTTALGDPLQDFEDLSVTVKNKSFFFFSLLSTHLSHSSGNTSAHIIHLHANSSAAVVPGGEHKGYAAARGGEEFTRALRRASAALRVELLGAVPKRPRRRRPAAEAGGGGG